MSSAIAKMPSFDTGCIKSLKKLPPSDHAVHGNDDSVHGAS